MNKKFKFRFFGLVMAMIMALSGIGGAIPAMAAEVDNTNTNVVESMEYTEEAEVLRAKIDEIIAENDKTRDTYKTDYWGYCEVTGTHEGANHSIYGHQARMCIAFKPLDGNGALDANLFTGFWGWTLHYNPWNVDDDGYMMYVGPWCDITYKGIYSMTYELFTTGGPVGDPNDIRTGAFHVWVDYK